MRRSRPRRTRIRLLATERAELERRVAARTSSQQDAYRAEIILRVAANQTDAAIAQEMGLAARTVFVWRHRFAEQCVLCLCGAIGSPSSAWMASRTIPRAHPHACTTLTSRLDYSCWPARNNPR
jgi:hypothetical protein